MEATDSKTDLQVQLDPDLVDEKQAAELLGISRRTFQNRFYLGDIPRDHYITLVTGKRRYYKSRLLGQPKPKTKNR